MRACISYERAYNITKTTNRAVLIDPRRDLKKRPSYLYLVICVRTKISERGGRLPPRLEVLGLEEVEESLQSAPVAYPAM